MTTIAIDDRYKDQVLKLLEPLPKEAYTIKPDPLREELARRIKEIDEGKAELTPFKEGMDALREKIKAKHADHAN